MSAVRCPICGTLFEPDEKAAMPFCGQPCRRIDLQRWLGEQYGLPYESAADPPTPEQDDTNP